MSYSSTCEAKVAGEYLRLVNAGQYQECCQKLPRLAFGDSADLQELDATAKSDVAKSDVKLLA